MTAQAVSAFRRRRVAGVAAVVLVVLSGAHAALWWVVTGRMIDGVRGFKAAAAESGWVIQTGPADRAGWPFSARVVLKDVSAARPLGSATLRWTTKQITVAINPSSPHMMQISPDSDQTIETGNQPPIALHMDMAELWVPLDNQAPVTARAKGLSMLSPHNEGLRLASVDATIDLTAIAATIQALTPVPALAAPFDGGAELSIRILSNQPFPLADNPAQSAALWRTAGGRIDVPEFVLHWGPLAASGHGSGDLDAALQPEGQAVVTVTGVDAVLDAAVKAGQLQAGPARAAKAVLSLMALAAGGKPTVLPLSLQDRRVVVATFPLFRLPKVSWSAP